MSSSSGRQVPNESYKQKPKVKMPGLKGTNAWLDCMDLYSHGIRDIDKRHLDEIGYGYGIDHFETIQYNTYALVTRPQHGTPTT